MSRFKFWAAFLASQVLLASPALAQQAGGQACTAAEATSFGGVTLQGGNAFQQFANFVIAGPVKYGLIAAVAVLILVLLLDNGHLPQIVKTILGAIAGLVAVGLLIMWISSQNICVS